jgi:hypothetical protein
MEIRHPEQFHPESLLRLFYPDTGLEYAEDYVVYYP